MDTTTRAKCSEQGDSSREGWGEHWLPAEDDLLRVLRAKGLSWADIKKAHFPRRSKNAVRGRGERIGLGLKKPSSVALKRPYRPGVDPRPML